MSFENYPSASCTIGGVAAKVNDGSVILDTGWAPYGQADITVPIESAEFAENIKPQDKPRVILTGRVHPTSNADRDTRQFDMVLRDREISHDQKTVRLMLATDEALLQTYGKLADDKNPRTHEANLRNLINSVLTQVIPGAALQAGTANADLTARWTLENRVTNPRGALDTSGWGAYANAASGTGSLERATWVTRPPGVPGSGAYTGISHVVQNPSTSWVDLWYQKGDLGVSAGQMYTASAWMGFKAIEGAAATRNMRAIIVWRNQAAQEISRSTGALVTASHGAGTSAWSGLHRVHVTGVAPAGAVNATLIFSLVDGLAQAGRGITLNGAMFTEGVLVDYFDGEFPATSEYTYTWQGLANNASSLRTPDIEREPDVFTWRAGESAWDFLQSLIGTTGLRLWCDEKRRWWLTNPAEYSVPGRISATADNSTRGTDRISIDGEGTNADGVIVRYQWNVLGEQRETIDTAGVAGKIFEHIIHAPYPGSGVAAAILRRIKNRRRMQDVTTVTDYSATPGKEISITLPGALDQVGYITRTNWLLAEGLMEVQAAALTEAEPGTWLAGYDELTWAGTPDARTWSNP